MTVRQHDQVKVLAYVAAAERARLANEDKAKAALELCADVVRAEFPTARFVDVAIEHDGGSFGNGIRVVRDADGKILWQIAFESGDDWEAHDRMWEAPWEDFVDPNFPDTTLTVDLEGS